MCDTVDKEEAPIPKWWCNNICFDDHLRYIKNNVSPNDDAWLLIWTAILSEYGSLNLSETGAVWYDSFGDSIARRLCDTVDCFTTWQAFYGCAKIWTGRPWALWWSHMKFILWD